jgi:hypothetical protein
MPAEITTRLAEAVRRAIADERLRQRRERLAEAVAHGLGGS